MRTAIALVPILALAACSDSGGGSAASSGKAVVIPGDRTLKESDYRIPGKVVVLDFTADW